MTNDDNSRFIPDVDTTSGAVRARKPFAMASENGRRFVRLEISSPMSLRRIKDIFGNFRPNEQTYDVEGTVLNISAGGVLVDLDEPLNDGDIVLMRFRLQGVEALENVLGLVKRCEQDDGLFLCGIEFVTRRFLEDNLSRSELELLGERLFDFQESVRGVLSRYLYAEPR